MARPSLDENPVYVQVQARLEPVKKIMDEARAECALIMRKAERKVEDDTLAALAYGVERGLSQYAVGKLMGKTRAEHQREIMARVESWIRGNGGEVFDTSVAETVDVLGWKWGPPVEGGWTPFVDPDGNVYTIGWDENTRIEWRYPDGTTMTFDERDALPREVEMYAAENLP